MDNMIEYDMIPLDILLPTEDVPSPVCIFSAEFLPGKDTESVIKIKIRRDLSIELKSVTVAFCFEPLTMPAGKKRKVTEVVCSSPALNSKETLTVSLKVDEKLRIKGGCAFVANVTYDTDMTITFSPHGLEKYITGDIFTSPAPKDAEAAQEHDTPDNSEKADELDEYSPAFENVPFTARKPVRIIIAAACVAVMVVSAVTASVLISRGRRTERLAEQLVVENRYNEAYKIVSDTVYKGVLQKVCESASNHYISKGDFCNAYIYSVAAPKPYAGKVIEEAKNELLSSENNASMNKNALTVIHQLDEGEEFDSVIISLSEVCCNNKKYGIAMSLAGEISSTEKRNSISSVIFTDGIKYYMENGLYENVGELIDAFGYHDDVIGELTDYCTSVGISVSSLIEECYNNGGSAAAVILSNYLGNSSADIPVNSEDQSIRRNLKTVYPLLTAEQKRAYHANRFSAYKEAYLIKDGAIEGTFITGAVSVDAGEYQSAVLDSKGNVIPIENNGHNLVIPIPEQGNTVQVAVGQKHIVLLENDGTVRAYGDNSYGQCDTAEWTDIVSVAAGASFTVGLRTDGTLVACGSNMCSQCDVSDYGGIVDIDALDQTVVMLFADGTVGLQGDVTLGIKDASLFKNVRRISAGDACIVAETSDGKYLMASGYAIGSCGSVADWQNYEMFCAGSVFAAAVDADGNIIYTGDGAPKH